MKVYLASSWKNEKAVSYIAELLRKEGHEVDAFTDTSTGRYVFHISEIGNPKNLHPEDFMKDSRTKKAFLEDKKWLDWCDCCLLILPCGKSAHLEGGYAKGKGKKLIIFAMRGYVKGDFDVMYKFADEYTDIFERVVEKLDELA